MCVYRVQGAFQLALVGMKLLAHICLISLFESKPCYRACLRTHLAKRRLMIWQNGPWYLRFLTFPDISTFL